MSMKHAPGGCCCDAVGYYSVYSHLFFDDRVNEGLVLPLDKVVRDRQICRYRFGENGLCSTEQLAEYPIFADDVSNRNSAKIQAVYAVPGSTISYWVRGSNKDHPDYPLRLDGSNSLITSPDDLMHAAWVLGADSGRSKETEDYSMALFADTLSTVEEEAHEDFPGPIGVGILSDHNISQTSGTVLEGKRFRLYFVFATPRPADPMGEPVASVEITATSTGQYASIGVGWDGTGFAPGQMVMGQSNDSTDDFIQNLPYPPGVLPCIKLGIPVDPNDSSKGDYYLATATGLVTGDTTIEVVIKPAISSSAGEHIEGEKLYIKSADILNEEGPLLGDVVSLDLPGPGFDNYNTKLHFLREDILESVPSDLVSWTPISSGSERVTIIPETDASPEVYHTIPTLHGVDSSPTSHARLWLVNSWQFGYVPSSPGLGTSSFVWVGPEGLGTLQFTTKNDPFTGYTVHQNVCMHVPYDGTNPLGGSHREIANKYGTSYPYRVGGHYLLAETYFVYDPREEDDGTRIRTGFCYVQATPDEATPVLNGIVKNDFPYAVWQYSGWPMETSAPLDNYDISPEARLYKQSASQTLKLTMAPVIAKEEELINEYFNNDFIGDYSYTRDVHKFREMTADTENELVIREISHTQERVFAITNSQKQAIVSTNWDPEGNLGVNYTRRHLPLPTGTMIGGLPEASYNINGAVLGCIREGSNWIACVAYTKLFFSNTGSGQSLVETYDGQLTTIEIIHNGDVIASRELTSLHDYLDGATGMDSIFFHRDRPFDGLGLTPTGAPIYFEHEWLEPEPSSKVRTTMHVGDLSLVSDSTIGHLRGSPKVWCTNEDYFLVGGFELTDQLTLSAPIPDTFKPSPTEWIFSYDLTRQVPIAFDSGITGDKDNPANWPLRYTVHVAPAGYVPLLNHQTDNIGIQNIRIYDRTLQLDQLGVMGDPPSASRYPSRVPV